TSPTAREVRHRPLRRLGGRSSNMADIDGFNEQGRRQRQASGADLYSLGLVNRGVALRALISAICAGEWLSQQAGSAGTGRVESCADAIADGRCSFAELVLHLRHV